MFKNHLKIAWRNLQKRKVFSGISILGLALGFASAILIFLYVNYHLQFDDFHNNADRIYRVVTEEHRDNVEYETAVPPGFSDGLKADFNYAEKAANIFFWRDIQLNVEKDKGVNRFKTDVAFAEKDFFEILNFPLIKKIGNKTIEEPNVAYITESFAKRFFGDENALGKTFVLENAETIEVIGMLKDLPEKTVINSEVFISYNTTKNYIDFVYSRSWGGIISGLWCFTLLHPDQDRNEIEASLASLVKKHRPTSKNVHKYQLQRLDEIHFDDNYVGGINVNLLWIFSLIGMFLIIIACINFVNISTAQAFYRSKEIAIRKVLGGVKSHLFWQFISETFIISLFALIIGFGLAVFVLPSFNELFNLQLDFQSILSYKVIGFALLLLLIVSFFAGSYPGILLARILPTLALKGKISQSDAGGKITRKVLVTTQFGISIVLIFATIIISKQINYAITSDLGFEKDAIVMVSIPEELENIKLNGLKQRISALPGVVNITGCLSSPGASNNTWGTSVRYHNRSEDEEFSMRAKLADEDYLKTFQLKLIAGRNFFPSDTIKEAVVNKKFAAKLGLPSFEELIGKKVEMNSGDIKATIVGVIDDFHDESFQNDINAVFIAPRTRSYGEFAIKIESQNVNTTLNDIQKQWEQVFPKYIYDVTFLDERVARQYAEEQRFLSLSKVFSGLAIFISCLGLYGLISFFLARKTKEIGIRKVLGGKVRDILVIVVKDFLKLIVVAGVIALPLAWYFMNNWLQTYTYRTDISWWIFAVTIGTMIVITLFTIGYQAVKAATANPIKSLRTE